MRRERLTLDDAGEGMVCAALLDAQPGAYLVAGLGQDDAGEYVDHAEARAEGEARAIAAEWRSKGLEVAVWRKVG